MFTPSIGYVFSNLEQWCQFNFDESDDAIIGTLSENVGLLENHPLYAETAFAIFRLNPLTIIHLSNTANEKYFLRANITEVYDLIEIISPFYLSFINEMIDLKKSYKKTEAMQIPNIKTSVCGIRVCVEGIQKTVAVHIQYIIFDDDGMPLVSIIIVDDISILLETEHYWIRCVLIDQDGSNGQARYFHKEEGKIFDHDIISERELLILQLMKDGLDIHTIANQLGISVNTVNNHKQNMYKRTGARNCTSLIELAIMCGIL